MSGEVVVEFDSPLLQGRIIDRPNRFIMNVEIDGEVKVAHCPSTGSIGGIPMNDLPCLVSGPYDLSRRKTEYTVEAIAVEEQDSAGFQWIGINQTAMNRYIRLAYLSNLLDVIPALAPTTEIRSEPRLGSGRLDFLVDDNIYIEVKAPLQILQVDTPRHTPRKHPGFYGASRMIRQLEELSDALGDDEVALLITAFGYDNPGFNPPPSSTDEVNRIWAAIRRAQKRGLQRWQVNFIILPDRIELGRVMRLV